MRRPDGQGHAPPGDTVHVWRVRLDAAPGTAQALYLLLGRDERRRADALACSRDRSRHVVAHGAVRLILSRYVTMPPARLRWTRGSAGKPELAGRATPRSNLSHSAGLALVAVSAGRPVGVDVERVRPGIAAAAMAKRWFPRTEAALLDDQEPAEQARRFAAMWVRKEACVKAAGGRLVQGLRLPVTAGPLVGDPSGVLPGPWRVRDLAGDLAGPLDGYAAALAVAGERPYRTEIRDWTVGPDLPPGFRAST